MQTERELEFTQIDLTRYEADYIAILSRIIQDDSINRANLDRLLREYPKDGMAFTGGVS